MDYGIEYFYNMLRMYAPTAKIICDARWEFVSEAKANIVLDYGSGCGFFKAFAPQGIIVDTYDPMPVPQTGLIHQEYDLITFWDVLEHIPNLGDMKSICDMAKFIAVTVPIKPPKLAWSKYKHFKPGEHIHHFQKEDLCALMQTFGFKLIKCGSPECPPRSMIGSFLFGRIS